mgnify:CR=1 FL=1
MSHDPHRNQTPRDPYREYRAENRTNAGAAILLAALLLAAIGGFAYFYAGAPNPGVATSDIRPPITQPSTTGAAPAPETTGASSITPAEPGPRTNSAE